MLGNRSSSRENVIINASLFQNNTRNWETKTIDVLYLLWNCVNRKPLAHTTGVIVTIMIHHLVMTGFCGRLSFPDFCMPFIELCLAIWLNGYPVWSKWTIWPLWYMFLATYCFNDRSYLTVYDIQSNCVSPVLIHHLHALELELIVPVREWFFKTRDRRPFIKDLLHSLSRWIIK